MLKQVDVPIDESVAVPCPLADFKTRRAHLACPSCPHYEGIGEMCAEGDWHQRYAIRCAAVIERRTVNVCIIEG